MKDLIRISKVEPKGEPKGESSLTAIDLEVAVGGEFSELKAAYLILTQELLDRGVIGAKYISTKLLIDLILIPVTTKSKIDITEED